MGAVVQRNVGTKVGVDIDPDFRCGKFRRDLALFIRILGALALGTRPQKDAEKQTEEEHTYILFTRRFSIDPDFGKRTSVARSTSTWHVREVVRLPSGGPQNILQNAPV